MVDGAAFGGVADGLMEREGARLGTCEGMELGLTDKDGRFEGTWDGMELGAPVGSGRKVGNKVCTGGGGKVGANVSKTADLEFPPIPLEPPIMPPLPMPLMRRPAGAKIMGVPGSKKPWPG